MSLSFSANGTAQSPNIAGVASLTAGWLKIMLMADVFRSLGNSDSAGIVQIATTTATNIKLVLFWSTNASGLITFTWGVSPGNTFTTVTALAQTAFPANGSPVVIYADWVSSTNHNVNIYSASGTSIQANNNVSNLGALPTTGGVNGAILLNDTNPSDKALACKILGLGIGSGSLATASQWTAPSVSDSGIQALYKLTDGTSGTTPSTAASTVPSSSQAITPAGTWSWAADPFWNTITATIGGQVGVTSAMTATLTGGGGGSSKIRKAAARHLLLFV